MSEIKNFLDNLSEYKYARWWALVGFSLAQTSAYSSERDDFYDDIKNSYLSGYLITVRDVVDNVQYQIPIEETCYCGNVSAMHAEVIDISDKDGNKIKDE